MECFSEPHNRREGEKKVLKINKILMGKYGFIAKLFYFYIEVDDIHLFYFTSYLLII